MGLEIDQIKRKVREFYDQIGWQEVSQGTYQNAHYEDLRPVAREYIHNCHLRVLRHLKPSGRYLLDAGSGPLQYPEYLEYSRGYRRRVCADISFVALQEARKRIGEHGLFVLADVANLPFQTGVFEGVVSLHTIHHLPMQEHSRAYQELYRVLTPGSGAVVVNGWDDSPLMSLANIPIWLIERLYALKERLSGKARRDGPESPVINLDESTHIEVNALTHWVNPKRKKRRKARGAIPKGTFVQKHNAGWLLQEVGNHIPLEILVWRSVTVRFLRVFIHPRWGGRRLLRLLFSLEERFPHLLGRIGQYPLIVFQKP